MARRSLPLAALLVGLALFPGVGAATPEADPAPRVPRKPMRLDEATMIVEVNATDGDAGLQVFLDGDPWRSMTISDPEGRRILNFATRGRVRKFGLTELFSESSEPPFGEFPLRKFKALFPEGKYTFSGTTVEGGKAVGRARLSHDIPDGPQIVSPAEGATVPRDNAVAAWNPVPEPGGIDVVAYRAIVERENPLRVFSVDLPSSVTSVTIPEEFLEPGVEYKLEVQAIESSGNQTITEITFQVS
jgi:hypothetical protein